jgi:hypothetical protein
VIHFFYYKYGKLHFGGFKNRVGFETHEHHRHVCETFRCIIVTTAPSWMPSIVVKTSMQIGFILVVVALHASWKMHELSIEAHGLFTNPS